MMNFENSIQVELEASQKDHRRALAWACEEKFSD